MKNIKVKVGRKYLTQCGEVVECYRVEQRKSFPYRIGDFWYDEQLRVPLGGGTFNDSYKIIAEQKEHIVKDTEMKPKKLKIKWGKRYVTRDGTVVVCTSFNGAGLFFCRTAESGLLTYALAGNTCNGAPWLDIVAAYKKPPKQTAPAIDVPVEALRQTVAALSAAEAPAPAIDVPVEAPAPEEPEYPALCWRPADGTVVVFHTEHLGYLVLLPRGAEIPLFIPPCTDTSIWERITPEKLYELLNEDIKNGRN